MQAGLFSTVSSAFIIDIYKQLQPDTSDQSAALLRAILLTLNHSAIPNETHTVLAVQKYPSSEIVTVNCLLYASLLLSLLAAFVAMLGKQWVNRYLEHKGGSTIERSGDRQRKFDGLKRWPFHFIIESLPVMLQIALLFLAGGLCRYMMTINIPVACTLIILTGLGGLFYVVVVIVGVYSYDCPFQTPASALLRSSWKTVGPYLTPILLPVWSNAHHHFVTLLETIQLRILRIGFSLPPIGLILHLPRIFRRRFQHSHLPTTQEGSHSLNPHDPPPWFAPNELAMIQKKNSDNVRCVSWVLNDITDPEALDAAILLAGTIWWFEDGIDIKPLYDLIVFTFDTCFSSDGALHQGSRNRAYYSGRAILWIHTLAVRKSEDVRVFPLPTKNYRGPPEDYDIVHLLSAFRQVGPDPHITNLLGFGGKVTHPHSQWTSSVLLHLSWATQTRPSFNSCRINFNLQKVNASTPQDVLLNLLLMCCNLLGSPVEEGVLKIQDKSYGISGLCRPSYSYHCSLATTQSGSSNKRLERLARPQILPTLRSLGEHYTS